MNASFVLLLVIPLVLILVPSLIALQIVLSLRKAFWPGLILPGIKLLLLSGYAIYTLHLTRAAVDSVGTAADSVSRLGYIVGGLLPVIGLFIDLVIYLVSRQKIKRDHQRELHRMNIQDLN